MDSIPLNWGRTPFNAQIFEIFQLCFGTKNLNNNFTECKTHEVFQEIFDLALETYRIYFRKPSDRVFDPIFSLDLQKMDVTDGHSKRLESAVLNNRASLLNLTLTSSTPYELRDKTIK